MAAIEAFGFQGLTPERLIRPETLVFLGREPFGSMSLTSIDAVSWSDAWAGRKVGVLSTVRVSFLGGEQLVLNKLPSRSPKDIADLALLSEVGLRPPRKGRRR